MLDFDPSRAPALPRDAATVIVLRDGDHGLEVFCVLRHTRSGFLGGAVVFPGGKVDASDAADTWDTLATKPHPRAAAFATETLTARTLAVAACRETLEEGAILPVVPVPGGALFEAEEVDRIGEELRSGKTTLADALSARGHRLAIDALVPWSRWITPEAESRRFDARFYLLPLPEGQVGHHDEHETTLSFWATPGEVLDRFLRCDIFLAPPTTRSLELLASAGDVRGALAMAERQSLHPVCPRFTLGDDGAPYLALPGHPSHEVRDRRIDGSTRFVLRDGIFVSGED